ncbi:MAG: hypothetical protein ACOC33_03775 [bacterium]
MKSIYLITAMKLGFKYLNIRRSKDGYFHSYYKRTSPSQRESFRVIDKITPCWYQDINDAIEHVTNNMCDLHEDCYNYVVIEEVEEGGFCDIKELWFKWDKYKNRYVSIEKPTELQNVIAFHH